MQNIKDDSIIDSNLLIVLIILVAIVLYNFNPEIQLWKNNFNSIIVNFQVYFILILIVLSVFLALCVFIYFSYKSVKFAYDRIERIREEKLTIKREIEEIEELLETKLPISQKELEKYIDKTKSKIKISRTTKDLISFTPELKKRLAKAVELLEELDKENKIKEIRERTKQAESKLIEIEEQRKQKIRQEENRKWKIKENLKIDENPVFKKDELTKNEIEALMEEGYNKINDYCIYEKKFCQILVKPILNHSVVHTFLVWGAKKILDDIEEVKEIEEHYTKDADITFKFQGKVYALEIETGTLLAKKEQLREKFNYLNRKYPKRFMIIVSNRDLLSKYKKLGFSTPRNKVPENLRKMLGI